VHGDEGLQVLAHPLLLELALRNLIDNALQHTPGGTAVCVQWVPQPGGPGWRCVMTASAAAAAAPGRVPGPAPPNGWGWGTK